MPKRKMVRVELLLLLALAAFAQQEGAGGPQRGAEILRQSEAAQTDYAREVIANGFPAAEGDRFAFLLLNRSRLVVPLLEEAIRTGLGQNPRPERQLALATEMLTYPGDEAALQAISRLIPLDERRFRPLVARTLDHSMNWYNPFDLAYRAHELGDESVWAEAVKWAGDAAMRPGGRRRWAQALNKRYGAGELPSLWERDPILQAIRPEQRESLRPEMIRLAEEDRRRKLAR